jgi:hypothetical protein
LFFLEGRLLNLASVASLDLDQAFGILFGVEITAGQSFKLIRLHPFRVGGLLVSPRPFVVKIFAGLGDGVLKVVKGVRGFGVFEKPRCVSVDQPIILKLDFPFDIVGQNPHRSARDELAILDQAARVIREIKGIRGVGDEAIVGDELSIPAAAKDSFNLTYNSSGLIKNCQFISCGSVGVLAHNVKGEVKFQDNRLIDGDTPRFFKDAKSPHPLHDFKNAVTEPSENFYNERPRRDEQSADTKRVQANQLEALACGDFYAKQDTKRLVKVKTCNRCEVQQTPFEKEQKIKYCVRCKRVCYCSKECQNADWVDHKLICRPDTDSP